MRGQSRDAGCVHQHTAPDFPWDTQALQEGLRALRADPAGVDGSTISAFWFWLSFVFFFQQNWQQRTDTAFGVGSGWPGHVQYLQDSRIIHAELGTRASAQTPLQAPGHPGGALAGTRAMGFDGEGAAGPRADPSEHLPGAASISEEFWCGRTRGTCPAGELARSANIRGINVPDFKNGFCLLAHP